MSSSHARKYLRRVQSAALTPDENDLSDAARAYLLTMSDTIPAGVFKELLEKGYLQQGRRSWTWTAKASKLVRKI